MQPGFSGGLGFDQMGVPDDHANQFAQPSMSEFETNPLDGSAAQQEPNMMNEAAADTEGIQSNATGDFWNQDFGGQNNNFGGDGLEVNEPNIQEDNFGGEYGQIMEVKQNKPRIGQAFDAPLTPEEEARIAEIENDQRERMQRLQDKEANEIAEKRDQQDKAREELKEWYEDKDRERLAKSKQNKEEEWAFLKTREEHKQSKNPWEKIVDNVEINANKYLGTRDVTRMRQAMQARKADIKSQGNDIGI